MHVRLRLVVASLVTAFTCLNPLSASATASSARLELSGVTGYAVLSLASPMRLSLADDAPGSSDVTARLGGDYAGFLIKGVTGRFVAGAVVIRGFAFQAKYKQIVWLGPPKPDLLLMPGRYTITFFADKPSSLGVRVRSGGVGLVRPRVRPAAVGVAAQRLDLTRVPVAPGALARSSVRAVVSPGQWLLAATYAEDAGASVQDAHVCISARGNCLPYVEDTGEFRSASLGGHASTFGAWTAPGQLDAGTYQVALTINGAGASAARERLGFVLVIR